jgi:hypothetical protein
VITFATSIISTLICATINGLGDHRRTGRLHTECEHKEREDGTKEFHKANIGKAANITEERSSFSIHFVIFTYSQSAESELMN